MKARGVNLNLGVTSAEMFAAKQKEKGRTGDYRPALS